MNLDDLTRFAELDTLNMRAHIDALPDRLAAAWANAATSTLPASLAQIERVVIAGTGTAALAGELLAAMYADNCKIPISVYRGLMLPVYVGGGHTLLIQAQRDSLTTEAEQRGVITLQLASFQNAELDNAPERTKLPWYLGVLLRLFSRAGWIPAPESQVEDAVESLRSRIPILGIESRVGKNSAKRIGGQMIGRIPVIYGAGIMLPVARRWKTQLNENAKTWAQYEESPESYHNAASGILFPMPLMTRVHVTFLLSPPFDAPQIARGHDLSFDLYMQQGIAVDKVKGRGNNPLSQVMSTIQYGDYVSYYVAMAYGVDPTPTPAITELHEKLTQQMTDQ